MPKVVALAGGVGGAKLAFGLARNLPPDELTVVVNTGDDDDFHGLHVAPDLDTVMYTLAGVVNPQTGWGRAGDTFAALKGLKEAGEETWFQLGDLDLAVHIRRTHLLREGHTLSEVTRELCERFGVRHAVVPMSDNPVRTIVHTPSEKLSFQEYFVKHRCEPEVRSLEFKGAGRATPSPYFEFAVARADALVIAPSNPFLSVDPILAIPGVAGALKGIRGIRVAISPIIGDRAVKGPAARLFDQIGGEPPSCVAVARRYVGLCTHMVIDRTDEHREEEIGRLGITPVVAQTLMNSNEDRVAMGRAVLDLIASST